ncbi:MAG: DUF309 domain-containing protein [Gloeomargarita sp. HHBFW_bins_162]
MELPPEFVEAIHQFNQGEYYACHDTLEALWMEAIEPERTLYQGLLQIAVAGYHLGNGNHRGAILLLGEGLNRLRRCPELPSDWDFPGLMTQAQTLLKELQTQQTPSFYLQLLAL